MTTYQNNRKILRKKKKTQQRRSFYFVLLMILGVIVIIGSIVLVSKLISKPTDYQTSQGFTVGDPDAPIEVIAFSNYSCGYCKIFSETTEKKLITDYAETGKISYRYVNLSNNDQLSINAAEASYCAAEQNMFFGYKSLLYTYAQAANGFSVENLIKYAKSVGLDVQAFENCMSDGTYEQAYLKDRSYAQSAGIRATPTFLVNGQLVTANELVSTIEDLLVD